MTGYIARRATMNYFMKTRGFCITRTLYIIIDIKMCEGASQLQKSVWFDKEQIYALRVGD